jgi:hypothetical protein
LPDVERHETGPMLLMMTIMLRSAADALIMCTLHVLLLLPHV